MFTLGQNVQAVVSSKFDKGTRDDVLTLSYPRVLTGRKYVACFQEYDS